MRTAALVAVPMLAAAIVAPAAADPMPGEQVAALTAGDHFEFRGYTRTAIGMEDHIWYFSPDGRVRAEMAVSKAGLGAMSVTYGIRASGTWWRTGDQLCVSWDMSASRLVGCYTVLAGPGGMVYLVTPQFFTGTLTPIPTATAERSTKK